MEVIIIFFVLFSSYSFATLQEIDCASVVAQNICPNDDITYWLYNSQVYEYQLHMNDINTLINASFTLGVKTAFLINGYDGNKDAFINEKIRPEYINKGYNVITVDNFPLVLKPCYVQAVANANQIANCFVEFFNLLLSLDKFSLSDAHVLGFSLGPQIAGRVGEILIGNGITLPRITGLDPAAPLFYGPAPYISSDCASVVDIIHTNSLLYGKLLSIGHVDFYVNDIVFQPHCTNLSLGELVLCSHTFSNDVFAESIDATHVFCGRDLLNIKSARMGEYVGMDGGIYTVATNTQYPYAQSTTC